jgi:hypothetical protein
VNGSACCAVEGISKAIVTCTTIAIRIPNRHLRAMPSSETAYCGRYVAFWLEISVTELVQVFRLRGARCALAGRKRRRRVPLYRGLECAITRRAAAGTCFGSLGGLRSDKILWKNSKEHAMTNLRSVAVLFVLVLLAAPLHGTEPWPLPLFSSDPKAVIEAADRRPASAEAGIVILDLQTTIRFLAGGRTQFSQRTVYRHESAAPTPPPARGSIWPSS